MKAPVTIDKAVERLIRKAMQERGQSFEQVVNDALRTALGTDDDDTEEPPFHVRSDDMGLRPGIAAGRVAASADELEADTYVELTHRLSR